VHAFSLQYRTIGNDIVSSHCGNDRSSHCTRQSVAERALSGRNICLYWKWFRQVAKIWTCKVRRTSWSKNDELKTEGRKAIRTYITMNRIECVKLRIVAIKYYRPDLCYYFKLKPMLTLLWPPCVADTDIIFCHCDFFLPTGVAYSGAQWCFQRCLFVSVFVSMFVCTITSERLNVGWWNLAVKGTLYKNLARVRMSRSKVKGKGHPGTKTKNCWVILIDNA